MGSIFNSSMDNVEESITIGHLPLSLNLKLERLRANIRSLVLFIIFPLKVSPYLTIYRLYMKYLAGRKSEFNEQFFTREGRNEFCSWAILIPSSQSKDYYPMHSRLADGDEDDI